MAILVMSAFQGSDRSGLAGVPDRSRSSCQARWKPSRRSTRQALFGVCQAPWPTSARGTRSWPPARRIRPSRQAARRPSRALESGGSSLQPPSPSPSSTEARKSPGRTHPPATTIRRPSGAIAKFLRAWRRGGASCQPADQHGVRPPPGDATCRRKTLALASPWRVSPPATTSVPSRAAAPSRFRPRGSEGPLLQEVAPGSRISTRREAGTPGSAPPAATRAPRSETSASRERGRVRAGPECHRPVAGS